MAATTNLIDEYFKIYTDSQKEYGDRVCVLMAVGSFYEVYSVDNRDEQIGNAKAVSDIIRCDFTNKNKAKRAQDNCSTRSCPDFCGFGTAYLSKYLPPLLNENYTVIIVDQIENAKSTKKGALVKRGIVAVHSPTLKSPEYETIGDSDCQLISLTIEFTGASTFIYSVSSVNNVTNSIEICENVVANLDEINRVLLRYQAREMIIYTIGLTQEITDHLTSSYKCKLNIIDTTETRYKEYTKPAVQNEYFRNVYSHIDFGLLTPLEYLNLNFKPLSVLNLMYTFDFIGKHDLRYLQNIALPKIIEDSDYLVLALNTLSQLNVTETFNTIDFTSTAIGRRYLKAMLAKPLKDPELIEQRYQFTEKLSSKGYNELERILNGILDFERFHRKMALEALLPAEFEKLDMCYTKILEIKGLDIGFGEFDNGLLDKLRSDYRSKLNLSMLNGGNDFIINFFNPNVIPQLDDLAAKRTEFETAIETIRCSFDSLLSKKANGSEQIIKIDSTDTEGHFLTCTKLRFEKLKSVLSETECKNLKIKTTSSGNTIKFSTDELNKISLQLTNYTQILRSQIKTHFNTLMKRYAFEFSDLFTQLKNYIEIVDITKSNLKCSIKFNYTKPILIPGDSAIRCREIRHPIIERITQTEYITNDIILDPNIPGMILYGLNSCGKSSLLRAIGLNVILAQAGLYVPCQHFEFSPFDTIISQVDLTDNLFNGKSSFVNEMIGLRKILSTAGPRTLVLSDELCKGTEESSAQAIVTATILRLIGTGSKFFFTSHLHGIAEIPEIKNESRLQIAHLSVSFSSDLIVFERKIKFGSGIRTYGLEVCKSIVSDSDFIDLAFRIRNAITETNTEVVTLKKSQYNKRKLLNKCEICGVKKNLETHHINFQSDCDDLGFVNGKSFHKNETFNLVCLCKKCHDLITYNKIICKGYIATSKGRILEYTTL